MEPASFELIKLIFNLHPFNFYVNQLIIYCLDLSVSLTDPMHWPVTFNIRVPKHVKRIFHTNSILYIS